MKIEKERPAVIFTKLISFLTRILNNSQNSPWITLLLSLQTSGKSSLWALWMNFGGISCVSPRGRYMSPGWWGGREKREQSETWVPGTSPTGSCGRSIQQITSKEAKAYVYLPHGLVLSAAEKKSRREIRHEIQSSPYYQLVSPALGCTGWYSSEVLLHHLRGTSIAGRRFVPAK